MKIITIIFVTIVYHSCGEEKSVVNPIQIEKDNPINYGYKIVKEIPHDKESFTQGLFYYNNALYESSGLYKQSSLRKIDKNTGNVLQEIHIEDEYFAEGITKIENNIFLVTWKSNIGMVYDIDNFLKKETFTYFTEGWGLTFDGEHLILSDGSNILYYINPSSKKVIKKLPIFDNHQPVFFLNELEFTMDNEIYANIWKTNKIAVINTLSGQVKAYIELSELSEKSGVTDKLDENVLNGIAYDKVEDTLYVTGKRWNKYFVLKINSAR